MRTSLHKANSNCRARRCRRQAAIGPGRPWLGHELRRAIRWRDPMGSPGPAPVIQLIFNALTRLAGSVYR